MKKHLLYAVFTLAGCCARGQGPCYFLYSSNTPDAEISQSLTELGDGSIYVTGKKANGPYGLNDVALLKFDSCGTLLWTKYYGDTLDDAGLYINKTANGDLVMTGETGNASGFNDIFFYRLDSSGNILVQKKYAAAINQSAKYIEQTADQGFVLCGYINGANMSNDSYVIKTDSAGTIVWQQQIGGNGNEYADAVHETSDGNYILTGDANSYGNGGYDVEVIKLGPAGNIIWDKTYGDNLNNGCQGIKELSSGHYISYGETEIYAGSPFDFFIEILDTAGNSSGRHVFGGSATDALFSLEELPGMNFICTGYSRSYNGLQAYDVVLFKTDSAGNMKWLKNFSSPGIDIGYQLLPSAFGGYLVTGLFAGNNDDFFLIRSDTLATTSVGISMPGQQTARYAYPNPCRNILTLELPAESAGGSAIFTDLQGRVCKTAALRAGKNNISTEDLPPAVYLLNTISGGGVTARQILCRE